MRLVIFIDIHLPTAVSLAVGSVIIIGVTLRRGIILFIRSARIPILTHLALMMVVSALSEIPTAWMIPKIPSATTSIMYRSGFMRGPSMANTHVAHTHIAYRRLMVATVVVALGCKVGVALTMHLISVTRTSGRDGAGRWVVHWADGVVIVA